MEDSRRLRRQAYVTDKIREMRQLDRRLCEVSRARRQVSLVELPEPVRAGWTRYFFIRPDLDRSPEAPVLRRLLPILQRVEYSGRKDFAQRDWRRGGKKAPTEHRPRALEEKEFWALPEDLQAHFALHRWTDCQGAKRRAFVYKYPWKLVSRIRPYYLTHRALPNSEAESEEAHIRGIQWGKGWPLRHLARVEGWGTYDAWDREPFDRRVPLTDVE